MKLLIAALSLTALAPSTLSAQTQRQVESIAVLQRLHSITNYEWAAPMLPSDGPKVFIVYGNPKDGPFGPVIGEPIFHPREATYVFRLGRQPSFSTATTTRSTPGKPTTTTHSVRSTR
jgi:hypothetical protein